MLSILFFIFSSCLCIFTAKGIKNPHNKILDCIHLRVPTISHIPFLEYWSDILTGLQLFFCVSISDMEDISEMFTIMGITQISRTICNISTVLPPLKKYSDKIRLGGINGSGTDYIFSGHASYSALSFIYLLRYGYSLYFLILYNLLSQVLISVSRNHYTVDVILAWIIVPLIWGNLFLCKRVPFCLNYVKILL